MHQLSVAIGHAAVAAAEFTTSCLRIRVKEVTLHALAEPGRLAACDGDPTIFEFLG